MNTERNTHVRRAWRLMLAGCLFANYVVAFEVTGVRPNAIGLPEVNIVLKPSAGVPPYSGLDDVADAFTNLRFVFDTGASGMVLFENQTLKLGVPSQQSTEGAVIFSDVGVGGSTDFNVSQPTHLSLGHFDQEPPDAYNAGTEQTDYPRQYSNIRLQLGPAGSGGGFLGPLGLSGIAGTPVMLGRISVVQPKFAEQFFGTIHTYVYDPNETPVAGPGILPTNLHIELSLKSFIRFTKTTPDGAPGPSLATNPFIGPDPLAAFEGQSPPLPTLPPGVRLSHNGKQVAASFLLDTGNQTSSISSKIAEQLNVRYVPGTHGTADPSLETFDPMNPASLGVVIEDQFQITVAGIAGNVVIAGFFLDSLQIKTQEGDPSSDTDPAHLNFPNAPVYIQDIELLDPLTMDTFVIDGIVGMNYLMASFREPLELFGNFQLGPFETLVFDFDSVPATLGVFAADYAANIPEAEQIPMPISSVFTLGLLFVTIAARASGPRHQ